MPTSKPASAALAQNGSLTPPPPELLQQWQQVHVDDRRERSQQGGAQQQQQRPIPCCAAGWYGVLPRRPAEPEGHERRKRHGDQRGDDKDRTAKATQHNFEGKEDRRQLGKIGCRDAGTDACHHQRTHHGFVAAQALRQPRSQSATDHSGRRICANGGAKADAQQGADNIDEAIGNVQAAAVLRHTVDHVRHGGKLIRTAEPVHEKGDHDTTDRGY
ncbi:MAG: hypothetical protein U0X20_04725 [Caldilineaceae bacterium]